MGQTVRRLTSEVVAEATTATTSATAAAGTRGSVYLPWGLSAFVLSFSALAGTGWAIKLASDEKEQREAEQLGLPARSLDPLSPTALTVPGLLGTSFQLSLAPSLAAALLGGRYTHAALLKPSPPSSPLAWSLATGIKVALLTHLASAFLTSSAIVAGSLAAKGSAASSSVPLQIRGAVSRYSPVDALDDELHRLQEVLSPPKRVFEHLSLFAKLCGLSTFVISIATWPILGLSLPTAVIVARRVASTHLRP